MKERTEWIKFIAEVHTESKPKEVDLEMLESFIRDKIKTLRMLMTHFNPKTLNQYFKLLEKRKKK